MIIINVLFLVGPLCAAVFDEFGYFSGQPRFNSSCGNLPEAEECEDDCTLLYNDCIQSCTDEGMESYHFNTGMFLLF